MNKVFGNLVVQFKEFFKNLTPVKRASIIIAFFITVGSAVIVSFMVGGANYAILLKDVPSDQVASVIKNLDKNNIPYKMMGEGKVIKVPQNLVHSAQMAMMAELGSSDIGTIGLEIFAKQDFGVTSYAQKVNYQRALQGELMRAVNSLGVVKRSKVILALPAKKTFLEEGGKASASVVIELHTGKILDKEQVTGITHLVASAVEGLSAEDVSVLDSRGKVLSRKYSMASALSSELLDVQNRIEQNLESRIESILSRVAGSGKVIAKVNVNLNTKHISSIEEIVDPDKTAIRSSVTEEERLDGSRSNPTGIPGARANLPGAQDNGQIGFKQNVKKELKTQNFEVGKTVRNVKEAAGNIISISVAVLVDGVTTTVEGQNGESDTKYVARTPEDLKKYESIVKNAIGFSLTRGDTVNIENMQFIKEDFNEAERLLTTLDRKRLIRSLFKWSLLGFSLALFFLIVVRPFMRWITDSFQDTVEDMLPRTIEELEELQSVDNSLPGMSGALPVLEESLDPEKAESELLKERILNILEKEEEKAKGAFSLWLVRKDP
ncbi:MAG: flagellar M-ring protein FliF [Bdellovibrionaceae bacterium]|nr:flagellar M-ring protein FliF [Pseudobdellovibrionaceae bacterium]